MKTSTLFSMAISLLMFMQTAQAKSLSATVSFRNENRTLSYYIPDNYDSTQQYNLMVCLHGLGDNSNNYRNALVNSLNWPSIYPNTIFVCPDGGSDRNKDFYMPLGDEGIIEMAINFMKTNYTINHSAVYLQGFSLGGRSALKYGLENPTIFKGLFLNTPAMQGLMDVQNNPASSLIYKYNNAPLLPLFITVGESDITYVSQVQALVKQLKKSNAPIQFELVKNLGHTIPSNAITQKGVSFVLNKTAPQLDADLFELEQRFHFCTNTVTPFCLIRNSGTTTITSLNLLLTAGSYTTTQQWNGTILPNQFVNIPLTLTIPVSGRYHFTAAITQVNNASADENISNNSQQQPIEIANENPLATVTFDFDKPQQDCFIKPSGSLFEWFIDEEVKKSGQSSISSLNNILLFYTRDAIESFTLPSINIAGLVKKELNFDLAFNYLKYTAPYFTTETSFADTLEVLISTDCGSTFTSLYKKGGKELATANSPIVNALTIQDCIFLPTPDQWRTETIDISAFSNTQKAIIKFNYISGMGGSINIDNISFGAAYTALDKIIPLTQDMISAFPNPANNVVHVQLPSSSKSTITISNLNGSSVLQQYFENTATATLQVNELPDGIYILQVLQSGQLITKKITINH